MTIDDFATSLSCIKIMDGKLEGGAITMNNAPQQPQLEREMKKEH